MQNELREKFTNYIEKNGIKVRFIANLLGLSESTLSHWRKGRRDISIKHIEKLLDIIN